MDVRGRTTLGAPARRVFEVVRDLSTYPSWLSIVSAATPVATEAWDVELQARVGVVRRSKRVRMVRTVEEAPRRVVFERREPDGRAHSVWRLTGTLREASDRCVLDMHLHYGGAPALPLIDVLLRQEVNRAGSRLAALIRP